MAENILSIKVDAKSWKVYGDALEAAKFERKFKRHRAKLLKAVGGRVLEKAIEKMTGTKPNAALTLMIKGSGSKPLEDTGKRLKRAAVVRLLNARAAFVGVPNRDKFAPIAKLIHDGGSIKVTPAMRQLFFMLWLVDAGSTDPSSLTGRAKELYERQPKGWKPLSQNTTSIVIPGRPYWQGAFENAEIRAFALQEIQAAVQAAINEVAYSSKKFGKPRRSRKK